MQVQGWSRRRSPEQRDSGQASTGFCRLAMTRTMTSTLEARSTRYDSMWSAPERMRSSASSTASCAGSPPIRSCGPPESSERPRRAELGWAGDRALHSIAGSSQSPWSLGSVRFLRPVMQLICLAHCRASDASEAEARAVARPLASATSASGSSSTSWVWNARKVSLPTRHGSSPRSCPPLPPVPRDGPERARRNCRP
jgi:hypothetical protein